MQDTADKNTPQNAKSNVFTLFYVDKSAKPAQTFECDSTPAYGRYKNVFLSDGELTELQTELPTLWQTYIDRLSEYMASTGKRYQSHAATIRRWAAEDRKKSAPPARNRDYSVKEDETV